MLRFASQVCEHVGACVEAYGELVSFGEGEQVSAAAAGGFEPTAGGFSPELFGEAFKEADVVERAVLVEDVVDERVRVEVLSRVFSRGGFLFFRMLTHWRRHAGQATRLCGVKRDTVEGILKEASMRCQDMLAELIVSNKTLLGRYLKGFSDANHTKQSTDVPNHVAWNLGHLALTMHRVAERLDGKALPVADFFPQGTTTGDSQRISPESVGFGSAPADDPTSYPSLARCVQVFENACDRLAAAARGASDQQLAAETPWGPAGMTTPTYLLVARMAFHNGFHCGQISDLRRAFKFASIFA